MCETITIPMTKIIKYQRDNQQVLWYIQQALTNIFVRIVSLEHGNNMDKYNNHRDITLGQPIGKQDFNKPYKRIATFNGCFYKK